MSFQVEHARDGSIVSVTEYGDGWLVTHHSLDGREQREQAAP